MTKYFVKVVSIATPANKNFAGQTHTAVYGKREVLLKHEGDPWFDCDLMSRYMINEYGYTRRQDAMRSWFYRNPENTEFWRTAVEIISAEC